MYKDWAVETWVWFHLISLPSSSPRAPSGNCLVLYEWMEDSSKVFYRLSVRAWRNTGDITSLIVEYYPADPTPPRSNCFFSYQPGDLGWIEHSSIGFRIVFSTVKTSEDQSSLRNEYVVVGESNCSRCWSVVSPHTKSLTQHRLSFSETLASPSH